MSKGTMCITTRVKNGLGELLKRPGGIGREQALADADVNVESLRSEYVKAVPGEIEALETVIAGVESGEISAGEIQEAAGLCGPSARLVRHLWVSAA